MPGILVEYAGSDGIFSAEEWANFLNGKELGAVLDVYHTSTQKVNLEMEWIDNAGIKDRKTTKGEIKAGIYNAIASKNIKVDLSAIDALIDQYAGKDGTFTTEEYKLLIKNPQYKKFIKQFNITPW